MNSNHHEPPAAASEQDALFEEIVLKMPSVTDPAKLEELALLALAMTVQGAKASAMRDQLAARIKSVCAEVSPGHSAEAMRNELRFAARGCIKILQAAREGHLPAPSHGAGGNWAQSDGHRTFQATHRVSADEAADNRTATLVALAAAVLVAAGGILWWTGRDTTDTTSDTTRFVDQVTNAVHGEVPATHVFGGSLKVSSMNGVPVVTAQGVPPRICAASGSRLVRKGLLSINGVTPTRVSAAIITELCNKEDGDATIMWAPK